MENKSSQQQKTLAERDHAVIWHPFTQMKTSGLPIAIARGEGARLYDEEGNEYIDAIASWWMNSHGHAHPYLAKKLAEQANTLEHAIFANFTHRPAVELAERLLEKLPENQARVFYSDNGSTSVEVGLKMCFQYWHNIGNPKTKIIAFKDAYHGDTFGAMSVGGRSAFTEPFAPFLFDVEFIDTPVAGKEELCIQQFEELIKDGDVAGFVFEPLILGAGGMLMYSTTVLEQLLGLCRKNNVVSIADEVMVGFGRTGKFFATDHISQKPDIFCLSKGLTGGTMALGVTTCTKDIFNAFYSDNKYKTLFHGHSCTGNPLACSVALASLDLFDKNETWDNILRITNKHKIFSEEIENNRLVGNLRQRGVILAFDIVIGSEVSYFNNIRDYVWEFFVRQKIILRPLGNTVYIFPPYCITDEELEKVYRAIKQLLTNIEVDHKQF